MNKIKVPFNDLSRIHSKIASDFLVESEEVISSSSFVLGPRVAMFENNYATLEEAEFCVAVDNGTNAIELMLRAAGIGPNDEVITSAMTFIATVFAIERIGARPILVDTLPGSPLIDYSKIEEKITSKTKAILIVTLHGRVEHLQLYSDIASRFNVPLFIDGAQSHLGRYNGTPLTKFARAVSTSFYPGKNLGSLGEGGAVLTDSPEIAKKVMLFRDWGAKEKYEHDYWGGNFRLHAIQAAFLNIKVPHLASWTKERQDIAKRYSQEIRRDLLRPEVESKGDHTYHIFDLNVTDRLNVISLLQQKGISTGIHYPRIVSDNKAYRHLDSNDLQNARVFAASTLSIPLFPGMTEDEISSVIETCNQIEKNQ
jgi:dTDP-4-amino-4,6-dideoxygalactose transaminase